MYIPDHKGHNFARRIEPIHQFMGYGMSPTYDLLPTTYYLSRRYVFGESCELCVLCGSILAMIWVGVN